MEVRHYKAGERIDALSTAGSDMERWSDFGITADVFRGSAVEVRETLHVPMIESDAPGSGNLDAFLVAMKQHAGERQLLFRSVINHGLAAHLRRHGIPFELLS